MWDAGIGAVTGEEPCAAHPALFITVKLLTPANRKGTQYSLSPSSPTQRGGPQNLSGAAKMARTVPTIEELDDVSEVHVVVTDNLTIGFHQGQGNEQDKVL